MKSKLLSTITMVILVGIIFCGCEAPQEANVSDYSISIKLSKERYVIGESIEAEIQFVNLTDKKYEIIHSGGVGEASFIGIHIYSVNTETLPTIDQNENSDYTIKPNEIINAKRYGSLEKIGDYYCFAFASFKIKDKDFFVKSEEVKITVEENQGDEIQDYVLKISADKQVYAEEEDIVIDITFENRSGANVEFAYYLLFYPESSTGQFPEYEIPPITSKKLLKNGDTIRKIDHLG